VWQQCKKKLFTGSANIDLNIVWSRVLHAADTFALTHADTIGCEHKCGILVKID